jgi:hypothetical protein
MKSLNKFVAVMAAVILNCLAVHADELPSAEDLPPQPQILITKGSNGSINTSWEGVADRVYFLQCSMDLQSWDFAQMVEFGTGTKYLGCLSTPARMFQRLAYYDDSRIQNIEQAGQADSDGDGIPNEWEVLNGFDPTTADSEAVFLQYIASLPASTVSFEVHTPLQP